MKPPALTSEEVHEAFRRAQENSRRLRGCPRHYFNADASKKLRAFGERVTCVECGGEMRVSDVGLYIQGYAAGGGISDDIWPGWDGGRRV